MAAELYVKRAGDGPAVVLLHGLFGAGGNLGALARALQASYTVFSVDLPNHGRSGSLAHPDLPAMAERLRQWLRDTGLSQAHFVGHSLGGKVAMQLALTCPQLVTSLVVADIAPVSYNPHHGGIFDALQAVAAAHCRSRDEASALMAPYVPEEGVMQFLLASLQRDPTAGEYRWRFDLDGLGTAYHELLAAPSLPANGAQHYDGPVLFIKGGASDYIRPEHWPEIHALFPRATIKVLPGCGHWLHAEKPQLFNGIVARFLAQHEQRKLSSTAQASEG